MTHDNHAPDVAQPPFSSPCAEGEIELVRGVHFLEPDSVVDEVMAEARTAEAEGRPADPG
jgi:hypothetical protein